MNTRNKRIIALAIIVAATVIAGTLTAGMLVAQGATTTTTTKFNFELHCPTTATVGVAVQCTAEAENAALPVTGTFTAQGSQQGSGTLTVTQGTNTPPFSLTFNAPGTFTVSISGSDSAGKTDTDTGTITVTGTTTPPPVPHFTLELTCPATATVGQTVNCTVAAAHQVLPVTGTFTAPGSTTPTGSMSIPTGSTTTIPLVFNSPGTFPVSVSGTDHTGASDTDHAAIMVTSPSIPMNVQLNCPSTATVNEQVTCVATSTGGQQPVSFTFNAPGGTPSTSTPGSGNTFTTMFPAAGTMTIGVTGVDTSGATQTVSKTVNVIATPPPQSTLHITLNCPATVQVGVQVTCTATPTGAQGPVTFTFAAPAGTPPAALPSSSNMFTTTFSAPGQMTVIVVGTDNVGVDIEHATVNVTLPQNQPPPSGLTLTSFTVSPQTVTVGQPATFTATFTGGTEQFSCVFNFVSNNNNGNGGSDNGGHGHHHHHDDNGQGDDIHHTGNDKNGDTGDSNNNNGGSGGSDPSCSQTSTFQHAGTVTATVVITDQNGATATGTLNFTVQGNAGSNSGSGGESEGNGGSGSGCNCSCCCSDNSGNNSDP